MTDFVQRIQHGFEQREKNGVRYLVIPSFVEAGIEKHCFTTRIGGVSDGVYATLNLSRTREQNPANKKENLKRICDAIGVAYDSLTLVNYAHGDGVYLMDKNDVGKGITKKTDLPPCDALVIRDGGITAHTLHADCVPLFLLDPIKRVACVSHAGWRGVYEGITGNIIRLFEQCGCRPRDILVGIGPHIMPCCFEVQEDVARLFIEKFGEDVTEVREGRTYVDLQLALLKQMEQCGLQPEHITCADLCTYCREDLFYSHRRDCGKTGAMGSFIAFC
ncbi:MAG: peptidoglycan editing factor PgeF [Christensenella sp.]|uniref:peptidoglycan editing factor PgeF n=1 Tax=Christensenella sp. TaxID=1935934 RepID=UPI002B2180B6|nr:peptidoglycan editing factor PgeF [Christensenella sp.]MEA5002959.1 peptidoglycan editing factor PgeF [Christensenella sp.]